jgi:hypothetical protein
VLENFRQKKQTNVLSEAAIIALADEPPTSELTGLREEALSRCVEKLMPKSRELLWRRYSGRQDSDEMADGPGMTSTAVRVALSKAAQVGNNGGRNRISHLPEAAAVDRKPAAESESLLFTLLLNFLPELSERFVVDLFQGLDGAEQFGVSFGFEVEIEFCKGHLFQ